MKLSALVMLGSVALAACSPAAKNSGPGSSAASGSGSGASGDPSEAASSDEAAPQEGSDSTTPTSGAPAPTEAPATTFPKPTADQTVTAKMAITGDFDGGMKRFIGAGALGGDGQAEGQDPLFELADGATLSNVILGKPAADGIHCNGTCKLSNVWWEDVGEDAATFRGTLATQTMTIDGGGARLAEDKVFQHNGPGTFIVRNFYIEDFGKVYRSCGNCSKQFARNIVLENVTVLAGAKSVGLVGVNDNYNDTATFKNVVILPSTTKKNLVICQKYTGNNTGAEPPKSGVDADGKVCKYVLGTDVLVKTQ